jgi:hypothetical protein
MSGSACVMHGMYGSNVMVTRTPLHCTDTKAVGPQAEGYSRVVGQRALDSPADAGAHRHALCQCADAGLCSEAGLLCRSIVPHILHCVQLPGAI